jgi:phage gpG-like protein
MSVGRSGDWALARRLLASGPARLKGAIATAVRQEAQLLRKQIVEGITNQAPGGQPFKPLAATTLAARRLRGFGGTKALLRRGDLRGSITVVVEGDEAFVGVSRKARNKSGTPLANIAEIHEFGAGPFIVPMTPRMRRFLFAMLRKAGVEPGTGHGGGGSGAVVVRIPPRPFLRPAFEAFKDGAQRRFLRRVAQLAGFAV